MDKTVIVIGGPTASGKSAIALELAQLLNTEIISADSRQVYKQMKIGTAMPVEQDLRLVKHHFTGHLELHEDWNAGIFAAEARNLIDQLFISNDYVIVCGGTGMYIKALTEGIAELPVVPDSIRNELKERLRTEGLEILATELTTIDPEYASNVDLKNPVRILRALELIKSSGLKMKDIRVAGIPLPYRVLNFMPGISRDELYIRINRRVEDMLSDGLEDEVRSLLPFRNLKALQTVGYKEFFQFFDGKITFDECTGKIQQHTRNYAKRQLTWFNNQTNSITIKTVKEILSKINV